MNRRQFFAGAAAAVVAASADKDAARAGGKRGAPRPGAGGGMRLAGLSLVELREQYRRQLFRDFLPFMERHVIDREYGGFMCMTGHDGSRESEKKSSWFEGRGTWVYAFLYNNLARERKYLDVARRSIDLVMRTEPSG